MSRVKIAEGDIVIEIEKASPFDMSPIRTPEQLSQAIRETPTLEGSAKILEELLNGPYDVDPDGNLIIAKSN